MSTIHYFQRYESKENWVTNSTLLLLSRLYHYNRQKFETVLNNLLEDNLITLNIGVSFNQQLKGIHNVIDGIISQESFSIGIETKLYDNFSVDQLTRHLDGFNSNHNSKILLALSKNKIDNSTSEQINNILKKKKYQDIKFISSTYETIYQLISDQLSDFDVEMKEILEDYVKLCSEHNLINDGKRTMLAVTAGTSINENFMYNIFYDPVSRNHNYPFDYLGLYVNKNIVAVGKILKLAMCNYVDGKLVGSYGFNINSLSKFEYENIKHIIENTPYYKLETDVKFFLVDKFHKTNFSKTSYSSLRGKRYFRLDEIEGFKEGMESADVANLLNGKSWE